MNIGILTFYYCHNYGAMLQAYALNNFLVKHGHDVFFINYKIPLLCNRYKIFPPHEYKKLKFLSKIKFFLNTLLNLKVKQRKRCRFVQFQNQCFKEISLDDINNVDIVIVGSDQIWNPTITGGYDPIYYGQLTSKGIPHVSYAASCPAEYIIGEIGSYFRNFKAIGVRENKTYNKIEELGYHPYLNIDPSLLLCESDYLPIMRTYLGISGKYIMIYNISGQNQLFTIATQLRQHNSWSIVGNFKSELHHVDIVYNDAGPQEFLSLIKNAECIVVSSFHGVAFSVIFHKSFVYYPFNNEKDDRVFTLLHLLNLEKCIYHDGIDFSSIKNVDWNCVDQILDKLRKESINYLLSVTKKY
jgi:hypothetical protein